MTTHDEARAALVNAQQAARAAALAAAASGMAVDTALSAFDAMNTTTPPPPVVHDPVIVLTVPATAVAGPVTVSAAVTVDPTRTASKVEFGIDGVLAATDTAPPYTATLNLTVGPRAISATVTDSGGVTAVDSKTVTVTASTPPPGGSVLPPGPLPTTISGDVSLGPGVYTLTADTIVTGKLTARGGQGAIRVQLNGHRWTWSIDTCTIDIQGTAKPGGRWSRGPGAYVAGDECWLLPSALGDYTAKPYTGGTVPVNAKTGLASEVVNLSADVVFEGPGDIHCSTLNHTAPRTAPGVAVTLKWARLEGLGLAGNLGHYPLHFHLAGDASRGSLIEGVVAVHSKNHAFVPHSSDGITFRQCVAFETWSDAFWWDSGDTTDDLLYDECLTFRTLPTDGFEPVRVGDFGSHFQTGYRLTGFRLNRGSNMVAQGCVAVATMGSIQASGFEWPEEDHGVWGFRGCVAHNNPVCGIFAWQNNVQLSDIDDFTAYANPIGVDHGAYTNCYQYHRLRTADNGIGVNLHAMGAGPREMTFEHTSLGDTTPLRLDKPSLKGRPTQIIGADYGPAQVVVVPLSAIPDGTQNSVALRLVFIGGGSQPPPVGQLPPTITISGPTTIAAPGSATVTATATSDPTLTIDKVEFLADGAVRATDVTPPFSGSVILAAGSHALTGRVTDSAGKTAVSSVVTCVVAGGTVPPPSGGDGGGTANAFPAGTVETRSGVKLTYQGPDWVLINQTDAAGTAFERPATTSMRSDLKGGGIGVDIGANMAAMSDAIEYFVARYKLNARGAFLGFSSGASILSKSIRGQYNPTAATKLVSRFYGLGLVGITWRMSGQSAYTGAQSGPMGPHPWPAHIRKVFMFSGLGHTAINRHAVGGADESPDGVTETMSMTASEFWHYLAVMFGLIPSTAPFVGIQPAVTSPAIFDAADPSKHVRLTLTPTPEAHQLGSTWFDTDDDFWKVMRS